MLAHCTTPLGPQLPCPAELVFGRKIWNKLLIVTSKPSDDQLRAYREKGFGIMTHKYQCEHPELHLNQPVYYQDVAKKTWASGKIGVGPEPRSYTVEDEQTGRPLHRNQQLLRPRMGANKIAPPLPEVVELWDRIGNNNTGDIPHSALSLVQPPAPPTCANTYSSTCGTTCGTTCGITCGNVYACSNTEKKGTNTSTSITHHDPQSKWICSSTTSTIRCLT